MQDVLLRFLHTRLILCGKLHEVDKENYSSSNFMMNICGSFGNNAKEPMQS